MAKELIYKKEPEVVKWDRIEEILKENDLAVANFKLIMKDCYGEFAGNDWKIAVAQLILDIKDTYGEEI